MLQKRRREDYDDDDYDSPPRTAVPPRTSAPPPRKVSKHDLAEKGRETPPMTEDFDALVSALPFSNGGINVTKELVSRLFLLPDLKIEAGDTRKGPGRSTLYEVELVGSQVGNVLGTHIPPMRIYLWIPAPYLSEHPAWIKALKRRSARKARAVGKEVKKEIAPINVDVDKVISDSKESMEGIQRQLDLIQQSLDKIKDHLVWLKKESEKSSNTTREVIKLLASIKSAVENQQ